MIKVFIAAPRHYSLRAQQFGELLKQSAGFPRQPVIVSRWHSRGPIVDPNADFARLGQLSENLSDIEQASVLVALMDKGIPKAAIGDTVWALSRCIPVVWIVGHNGEGRNLFDSHSLVSRIVADIPEEQIATRVSQTILRHVSEAA